MTPQYRTATAIAASFLIFSLAQAYVGARLIEPRSNTKATTTPQTQRQRAAKLITSDNKPVLVNGNKASTGTTILSGATIEVPEGVAAEVGWKQQGDVLLSPETKATLVFSETKIEVRLMQGGVHLTTTVGTTGVVNTEQGRAGTIGPEQAASLDVFFPPGAQSPIVDQGEVLKIVEEFPPGNCAECKKLVGLCWYYVPPIIGGVIGGGIIIGHHRGRNPSPMTPGR